MTRYHAMSVLSPNSAAPGARAERVAFDKDYLKKEPTLEWITPGHPLFETVRHQRVSALILSNIVLSLRWSALSLRPVGASGAK